MIVKPGIELPETAIADICRIHQVRELSLFGSAARGEMGPIAILIFLTIFFPVHALGFWGWRR